MSSDTKKSDSRCYLKCCICQANIDRNKCESAKIFKECGRTSHDECFNFWKECSQMCPGCAAPDWKCDAQTIKVNSVNTADAWITDEKVEDLMVTLEGINSELQACDDGQERIRYICTMHDELSDFFQCHKNND